MGTKVEVEKVETGETSGDGGDGNDDNDKKEDDKNYNDNNEEDKNEDDRSGNCDNAHNDHDDHEDKGNDDEDDEDNEDNDKTNDDGDLSNKESDEHGDADEDGDKTLVDEDDTSDGETDKPQAWPAGFDLDNHPPFLDCPFWYLPLIPKWAKAHANPYPSVKPDPLDWWTDELPDQWTIAVDWYQGGPEPDPKKVVRMCPMTYWGEKHRVIKYIEPTEYFEYTQEEADRSFCNGRLTMEQHVALLDRQLTEIEKCRNSARRVDLMVNWWVRTGQKWPIYEGWWFIKDGQRWWEEEKEVDLGHFRLS